MSRRMDLTPFAASGPCQPAVEVTGRQGQNATLRERICDLPKVKIGPGQMLDGVPKSDHVRQNTKLVCQKICAPCFDTEILASVGNRVLREIDARQ